MSGLRQHDTLRFGTGFIYRRNVTKTVTPGRTVYTGYDIGGNAIRRWDGLGHEATATTEAYTNHAAQFALNRRWGVHSQWVCRHEPEPSSAGFGLAKPASS